MRERAPHTLEWASRMWALSPSRIQGRGPVETCPDDLAPLFKLASDEYLPYLAANAEAYARGDKTTEFANRGVTWRVPTAPYRVTCLNALREAFAALDEGAREKVEQRLGSPVAAILNSPVTTAELDQSGDAQDRLWRGPLRN
jgi:hypothetical protein